MVSWVIVCFFSVKLHSVVFLLSAKHARLGVRETTGLCTGSTKNQACKNRALPFTQHCFQRILYLTLSDVYFKLNNNTTTCVHIKHRAMISDNLHWILNPVIQW